MIAFSLNRPHWADSVIESPYPSGCLSICLSVCFFAPIGAFCQKIDPPIKFFFLVMAMVILSASAKRFSVSSMRDFLLIEINKEKSTWI